MKVQVIDLRSVCFFLLFAWRWRCFLAFSPIQQNCSVSFKARLNRYRYRNKNLNLNGNRDRHEHLQEVTRMRMDAQDTTDTDIDDVELDLNSDDNFDADICIIGGGIGGLSAAIEAASLSSSSKLKIVLLESKETPGGRASSDYTKNGYTLDRGYAVFIEQYPQSKLLFDYEELDLRPYDPGALIKIKNDKNGNSFARVADPLRQPWKLFEALTTSVGTKMDLLRLIPLFYYVKTQSVTELFENEKKVEVDTLSCLKNQYKFSDKMIQEFFEPFLTGIFFAPLSQQSSNMFHFVFKMFADGAATLPKGGIQAISNQLMEKAINFGVDVRLNHTVNKLSLLGPSTCRKSESGSGYRVEVTDFDGASTSIRCKTVICATEGPFAEKLLSNIESIPTNTIEGMNMNTIREDEGLETETSKATAKFENVAPQTQPQRSVGCFYYSFQTETPVTDKVLILNGEGIDSGPALTVSFLHCIHDSYAPLNSGLCSVSISSRYMDKYAQEEEKLDGLIRTQLSKWWPKYKNDIWEQWHLEKTYRISHAQPGQYDDKKQGSSSYPANVNGGRDCTNLRGMKLPRGVFVCGDHMATSTLNGAIESGRNAAQAAINILLI